jgi:hypothetical protein
MKIGDWIQKNHVDPDSTITLVGKVLFYRECEVNAFTSELNEEIRELKELLRNAESIFTPGCRSDLNWQDKKNKILNPKEGE